MASKDLADVSIRTTVPKDALNMSEGLSKDEALQAAMSNRKLAMWQGIQTQLLTFSRLRASDPVKAKRIYDINEQLLSLSASGSFRKLCEHVGSVENPKEEILTYYVVRAFKAALLNNHLMVAGYIIDQGYPFNKSTVPNVLLEILAHTVRDFTETYKAGETASLLDCSTVKIYVCYMILCLPSKLVLFFLNLILTQYHQPQLHPINPIQHNDTTGPNHPQPRCSEEGHPGGARVRHH